MAESLAQDHKGGDLNSAAERMVGILDDPHAAKPPEATEEVAETESETIEDSQEETVEQETSQEETVETDEVEAEATETGAETGAEAIELGADDLSSILGLEEDRINITDDGALKFRVKGEDGETDVNLDDLVNAYQGNANLTNRSKQLAEIEKAKTAEVEAFKETATNFAQEAAIRLEAINNQFMSEYESINWNELKTEDPAQWSAKQVEMSQRKAQIDQLVQQTLADINQQQATIDEQSKAAMQEKIANEQKAMVDAFKPLDVKVDETLGNQITEYLSKSFAPEEMENMVDHRLMLMAYKASLFDKGRTKAQDKQVKKVPPVLKKGKKPTKQQVKINENQKVRAKLKETGDMRDAAAALKGLL